MINVLTYPLFWFVVCFGVLWASSEAGIYLRGERVFSEAVRDDLKLVLSATLTLLALIIGFSFSMAATRYDQRRNLEEEEANAIGTEYVRVLLLPAPEAARAQSMLRRYLDLRIAFYTTRDNDELGRIEKATTLLQTAMWAVVTQAAAAKPTPVAALVASGMNDVINAQGYTSAAWINRIPTSAWALLAAIAIGCCFLLGYVRQRADRSRTAFLMPLIIAVALFLIADLDSPRAGFIRIGPYNLVTLESSLR